MWLQCVLRECDRRLRAGRKLRDRVALIEILPILRKAAEERRRGRIPFCGRIERRPLPLSSITFGCRRARN